MSRDSTRDSIMNSQHQIKRRRRKPDPNVETAYVGKAAAAAYLDVGVRTLESWMADGVVAYYRIGNVVRFKLSELDEVMSSFRRDAISAQ